MKASEVMTRDVLTVGPETSLAAAAKLMVEKRVSGLPIVDGNRHVLGMLTEGDLLHRGETGTSVVHRSRWLEFLLGSSQTAANYVASHSRRVGDLMTTDTASVTEDASLQEVVDLMERRKVRRVPVVRDGVLVGVVSRLDLVRALALKLIEVSQATSDREIEQRLRAELKAQPWLAADNLSISVHDGVVTLDGFIFDERCRKALHVAASNMAEGIKVEDRLIWTTPNMAMPGA